MNPELSSVLAQLAQKLGTSVEHLWPILVAREKFQAGLGVIALGSGLVICASIIIWGVRQCRAAKRSDFYVDTDGYVGVTIAASILGILFSIGLCACVPDYFFPEVAALRSIVGK